MRGNLNFPLRAARLIVAAAAGVFLNAAPPAFAVDEVHDEIQVYNAEIAEIGQWTYEQHLNYAVVGQTQPGMPGGFYSNHSLQGTPEFAYGLADWWEAGFYLPFAVTDTGEFLSDGAKIRSLFVVPDAAKRNFFYGINFELGYECRTFPRRRGIWRSGQSSVSATRNGSSSSIRSSTSASARLAKRILRRPYGLPTISAKIASSASNITPTSARSAISCRCASSIRKCTPLPTSR